VPPFFLWENQEWVRGAAREDVGSRGRFTGRFRLLPFAEPSPRLTAALIEIGKPAGMLDAKDVLERGPVDLIVNPALSVKNSENSTHTAGTTFMG